jgi:hypothetical protein
MSISDTTPQIEQLQAGILRAMSGVERLRLAIDMSETMRGLAFDRLERKHPGISQRDLIREFFRCTLRVDEIPTALR